VKGQRDSWLYYRPKPARLTNQGLPPLIDCVGCVELFTQLGGGASKSAAFGVLFFRFRRPLPGSEFWDELDSGRSCLGIVRPDDLA